MAEKAASVKGWPTRTQVLIIGAGPTGLTLGIALRQRGIECLILDKMPAPLPWSRALGLHARTQEILAALDVLDAVTARSLKQRAVSVYGDRGPLFSLDLTVLDAPYPHVLSCPQAEVEECLAARFAALGGMLVRDCELLDFRQDDEGVEARMHWAAQERFLRADLMVGCDGSASKVRDLLGISFDGERYPDHFVLADMDIDWPLARDSSHGFLLGDGALIAIPMPDGWRLIINQTDDEDLAPQLDLTPFRDRLAQCHAHFEGEMPVLGEPRWLSRFSIHRRLAGRYRRNRVLLAGDACHIQSPLGAQGMNTGIGDAFNLGWKLAAYLQGHGDGRLLDSYEQERRPVARQMLAAVDLLSRSSFARAAPLRHLRNGVLRFAGNRPQLGARLVRRASQLDVNYRNSPIVTASSGAMVGRRQSGPEPGDRIPDAAWRAAADGRPGRLHECQRSGAFQLLIQLPAAADLDHAAVLAIYALLARLPEEFGHLLGIQIMASEAVWPDKLRDLLDRPSPGAAPGLWVAEGEGVARYFGDQGQLWLMRPDGHLAFRGPLTDADELMHYLADVYRR